MLDEYEKTQKIDISKIICDSCKKTNKATSYKNIFYRCNQCKLNLCVNCQNKHQNENKDHNLINYDDKNYICESHNEKYSSYCDNCLKNTCLYCEKEHEEDLEYRRHKLQNYVKILPNMKKAKTNLEELRNKIDEFEEVLDNLISKLNRVKDIIENYYEINTNIFDSLNNKCINYEILYSFNKINESEIFNDINIVIKSKDNNEIFKKINEIYNKMTNKFNEEITIQYEIKKNSKEITLFWETFVENNIYNCKMIIGGKEYELKDIIELNNLPIKNNILEIKLKGIQNIDNANSMFYKCSSLVALPDLSKWNTNNIINMMRMFAECSSLTSLPDISNWNTSNVKNLSRIFDSCSSLISIPDISKWNIANATFIGGMFMNCSSLKSLPDISIWNTSNVNNIRNLFNKCSSLKSLPDISKWDTSNVTDMQYLFAECNKLESLPDISI